MTDSSKPLKELFLSVLEVAPNHRAEWFYRECDDDAGLREQLKLMLAAHEAPHSLLDQPAMVEQGAPIDHPITQPGDTIGPYKLREQLGEGGMGIVYVAEQIEPVKRKVALKIIKPGMASKDIVTRFEAERQALAMMDHPNIAKVHDAGATDTGQPYIVMELVQGLPITEYCDHHRLTINQRLRLFASVCRAVQHAHQKGIIHRDLKPSNIIVAEVDDAAVPKVIDFGVAKAIGPKLTEATLYTHFTQMVGTPLYMSPEQTGLGVVDIDTRSDVYSLGVLLYELLTGNTPFDNEALKQAGFDEMRRIIRDDDPPTPSAKVSTLNAESLSTILQRRGGTTRKLSESLKGELDWLVMKALEKNRDRRYESASALVADVQRYLDGEPIEASPPSFTYRCRKLAARHKAALATVAAVLVTLLLGISGTSWQAWRATQERDAKQAVLDDVKQEKSRSEENYRLAIQALEETLAESTVGELIVEPIDDNRKELVRRGIAFYERLAKRNGVTATIWPAYRLLLFNQKLGDALALQQQSPTAAEHAFREAIELAEAMVTATSGNAKNLARLVHAISDYGQLLAATGRFESAMQQSLRAEQLLNDLMAGDPNNALTDFTAGIVFYNRSAYQQALGQMEQSEQACRHALAHLQNLSDDSLSNPRYWTLSVKLLASCRYNLGMHMAIQGKPQESERLWGESLEAWRTLTLLEPLSSEYQSRAGATLSNLAVLARDQGDFARCRQLAEEAIAFQRRALETSPVYKLTEEFLRTHHKHLAGALTQLGDYRALATAAEKRAAELAQFPVEVSQAAISLAVCSRQVRSDTELTEASRDTKAEGYAMQATRLLDDALDRYSDHAAVRAIGDAYLEAGDQFQQAGLVETSRGAWESALAVFTDLHQHTSRPQSKPLDDLINDIKTRLGADTSDADGTANGRDATENGR